MADGDYEEGWRVDRVALPDTSSDWSITKAIRDYADPEKSGRSPENSGLNLLFAKHQIADMLGGGQPVPSASGTTQQDDRIKSLLEPGVPYPQGDAAAMLDCMVASHPGSITRITSTHNAHKPLDPHTQYQAADVTTRDAQATMAAAAACGAIYQQDEYAHPSPGSTGGHVHLQTRPGRGGATGPYYPPIEP